MKFKYIIKNDFLITFDVIIDILEFTSEEQLL